MLRSLRPLRLRFLRRRLSLFLRLQWLRQWRLCLQRPSQRRLCEQRIPNGGYVRRTYPANARPDGYANAEYRKPQYTGNASRSRRPDEPGVISDYGFDPTTRNMADSAEPHRATRPENQ